VLRDYRVRSAIDGIRASSLASPNRESAWAAESRRSRCTRWPRNRLCHFEQPCGCATREPYLLRTYADRAI